MLKIENSAGMEKVNFSGIKEARIETGNYVPSGTRCDF